MLEAIVWGLVQGLTEFLPVSSSGHLRVVPDLLGLDPPDLATSAVLHLGTLVAVLAFYRKDIGWMVRGIHSDPRARRMVLMLVVATVPAVVAGTVLVEQVERFQDSATAVGAALVATGAILLAAQLAAERTRSAEDLSTLDSVGMGMAQALALLPGISRSGAVIAAGLMRGLSGTQAARFGFLMAVPVTLGAGAREALAVAGAGAQIPELIAGVVVAAVSGYWAISLLLRALLRHGLWPFSAYCFLIGAVALVWL